MGLGRLAIKHGVLGSRHFLWGIALESPKNILASLKQVFF